MIYRNFQNFKSKNLRTVICSTLLISSFLLPMVGFSQSYFTTNNGCKCFFSEISSIVKIEWSGECINGSANGSGKLIVYYNNQSVTTYEGNLTDGKRDGYGTFINSKNDRYEGQFKNGKFEGKGVYTFANGGEYSGDWVNGEYCGKGVMIHKDGIKYEGEFKNGTRNGIGTMYFVNGNRYEGEWVNGKYEGQGVFYWINGNIYSGEWINSKRNGYGTLTYANGEKQSGKWEDGELTKSMNVNQSLFSISRPNMLSWRFSLDIDGTSNLVYIENNNVLPLSNDYYHLRTVPFYGYKANVKIGNGILGFNFHYENDNLKPSFNNVVIEKRMAKTMQRVIKFAGYIPISMNRGVSLYTEFFAMKFQNRFEVNQTLQFESNTLQSDQNYVYSNNYKEYMFGLKGINYSSNIQVEMTSGFAYSTIQMPHFNALDIKIEPIVSKKIGIFYKFEFKDNNADRFFETHSYGIKFDMGFGRIEKEDKSIFLFDNKKELLFTGSTVFSKHFIAKHVNINLSGSYRSLTPASKVDKVLFGSTSIITAIVGTLGAFQISKRSYGNSIKETSWYSAARVIITPISNFALIKINNYIYKKYKGREPYDIAQSELFYTASLNFYF